MRRIILIFCFVFLLTNFADAAHILEPLGTETAATPPRGRMFGQVVYEQEEPMPVEFEIGLGEKTQLNLEGAIQLRHEDSKGQQESGVREIGFGIKHRFLDETAGSPDLAFEVEFSPTIGLKGNEQGSKFVLILSKHVTPRFVLHIDGAYELETEREIKLPNTDNLVSHESWFLNVAPLFVIIPDRLMFVTEINGSHDVSGESELTLMPEIIAVIQTDTFSVLQNLSLKLSFPMELDGHADGHGQRVMFGLSKLF